MIIIRKRIIRSVLGRWNRSNIVVQLGYPAIYEPKRPSFAFARVLGSSELVSQDRRCYIARLGQHERTASDRETPYVKFFSRSVL